ncbi:hypothetical protein KP509_32G055400 [Ceratopteris richardii]|nr:hypothetical protein KP509_32G055400 [Ceratopteris richardii]
MAAGTLLGNVLNEQRRFYKDFLFNLLEQRALLNSIREELGLQKIYSDIRKETLALSEEAIFSLPGRKIKTETMVSEVGKLSYLDAGADELRIKRVKNEVDLQYYIDDKTLESRAEVAVDSIKRVLSESTEVVVAGKASEVCKERSTGVPDNTSDGGNLVNLSKMASRKGELTAKKDNENSFQHPPWPEWERLLESLRQYMPKTVDQDTGNELFNDTTLLKRALVKYAQAQEGAFSSLSQEDLLELLQHDLPSMDAKTAAGKKKLKDYLESDKNHSRKVPQAKLTDVIRLLYRAIRSMPMLGDTFPAKLRTAVISILNVLDTVSNAQSKARKLELANSNAFSSISGVNEEIIQSKNGFSEGIKSVDEEEDFRKIRDMHGSLDPPKYGSLKERVDARRQRLARESKEKEDASLQQSRSIVLQDLKFASEKSTTAAKKSKDIDIAPRNFEPFDALILSYDSDGHERLKSPQNCVYGASEYQFIAKKVEEHYYKSGTKDINCSSFPHAKNFDEELIFEDVEESDSDTDMEGFDDLICKS